MSIVITGANGSVGTDLVKKLSIKHKVFAIYRRKNIEVKREPVEIQIKHISLDDFTESTITFSVICSKGTYIRVLGKEIAEKLETVGYLTSLIRTQVGGYSIDESQSIQEFEASWKLSTK